MDRHSNDIIFSALELAKIGFFRYLFDGTMLSIDQTTFNFFELEDIFKDPESVIGQNVESLLNYTGSPGRLRAEIKKKGKVAGLEYGFKTLKGNEKWGIHNSFFIIDAETGKEAIQVCFYDITERVKLIRELEEYRHNLEKMVSEKTNELKQKTKYLEEANIALKVLSEHQEKDRKEIEKRLYKNIEKLVFPYIDELKGIILDTKGNTYLNILESNLKEVIGHFSPGLSDQILKLTPAEIKIADLIKQGKTTKEIADLLNLSTRTINFHRESIRGKLGLKNQKVNLRTHLMNLI